MTTETSAPAGLLPAPEAVRLVDEDGNRGTGCDLTAPSTQTLRRLYHDMVVGRRLDEQSTALTRQGRLAVYPSSRGQEACQIGAAAVLEDGDWLFPTYRDSVAIFSRGVPPPEVLTLLRGDWHCGYDPYAHRVAPQCTPLATNAPHAAGLAYALRRREDPGVALVLMGDGATSEGDAHEGFNLAAVLQAPVVFFVQNNGYAISVSRERQSLAPTLAHKGVGYGLPGVLVDGNDAAAVYAVLSAAVERARAGGGPTLVEALTYRVEAHTNADDASRYRDPAEVEVWARRDPVERLRRLLRTEGVLDDEAEAAIHAEAEERAAALRAALGTDVENDPLEMFAHVYATPTRALTEQRDRLVAELSTQAGVE